MCAFRKNDKCPPWEIRSGVMTHDKIKKTIYYDDTVVKIFDIPVFFFPKFAHPDPTVERRSGFLPPTLASSKNLGTSFTLPYFFDNNDRDFTISPRLFRDENLYFWVNIDKLLRTQT